MAADKPEQVLDLLKEAAVQCGLELNRELSLYIDVGADALYDIVSESFSLSSFFNMITALFSVYKV